MAIKNISDKELDECIDEILELFKGHIIITNQVFIAAYDQWQKTATTEEEIQANHDKRMLFEFRVIRKMEEFGILTTTEVGGKKEHYELTQFGRDVLKYDSWSAYRKAKHQKELDDAKMVHELVNQSFINKHSGWFALIISLAALRVSIQQCRQGENKEPDNIPAQLPPNSVHPNHKGDDTIASKKYHTSDTINHPKKN